MTPISISEDEWALIALALECALKEAWAGDEPELAEHLEEPARRLQLRLSQGGNRDAVTEGELDAATASLSFAVNPDHAGRWAPHQRKLMEELDVRISVEMVMREIS